MSTLFPELKQTCPLRRWSDSAVDDIRKTKVPRARCVSLARHQAHAPQVIFYAKDANLQMLSKVAQYVIKNESGLWLVVVHFFDDETSPMLQELANNISVLVKYFLPRLLSPHVLSSSDI